MIKSGWALITSSKYTSRNVDIVPVTARWKKVTRTSSTPMLRWRSFSHRTKQSVADPVALLIQQCKLKRHSAIFECA